MIRRQLLQSPLAPSVRKDLVALLSQALKAPHGTGQPFVIETDYGTGKFRILVIWDAWERESLEVRTQIIFEAYEQVEGPPGRDRIGLASGLTIPEAVAAGMLPFVLIPTRRSSDRVSVEEIEQALIEEGASVLMRTELQPLQLRFSTYEEAQESLDRLVKRLPGTEELWFVTRDLNSAAAFRYDGLE